MAHGPRIWGVHPCGGRVVFLHPLHADAEQRIGGGGRRLAGSEPRSPRGHGPNLGHVLGVHQQLDREAKPVGQRKEGRAPSHGEPGIPGPSRGVAGVQCGVVPRRARPLGHVAHRDRCLACAVWRNHASASRLEELPGCRKGILGCGLRRSGDAVGGLFHPCATPAGDVDCRPKRGPSRPHGSDGGARRSVDHVRRTGGMDRADLGRGLGGHCDPKHRSAGQGIEAGPASHGAGGLARSPRAGHTG